MFLFTALTCRGTTKILFFCDNISLGMRNLGSYGVLFQPRIEKGIFYFLLPGSKRVSMNNLLFYIYL